MDCSLTGSFVHGILQARRLEWVAISFSRGSSHTGIGPTSPAMADRFFTTEPPGKPLVVDYSNPDGLRAIAECVSSAQTGHKGTEHLKLPVHVKPTHKYFSSQKCTFFMSIFSCCIEKAHMQQ